MQSMVHIDYSTIWESGWIDTSEEDSLINLFDKIDIEEQSLQFNRNGNILLLQIHQLSKWSSIE